jgi:hypothetical protein
VAEFLTNKRTLTASLLASSAGYVATPKGPTGRLTRDDTLVAAEALAAVLDRDDAAIARLRRGNPWHLEWIGGRVEELARGRDGEESWRPGLAAGFMLKIVGNGLPIPALDRARQAMIEEVMDALTRGAVEGLTRRPGARLQ